MAIYHLEAKVVSRGAGRSAAAAAAYLSCSRIYNDYDGIQHDYTRKQGLVWQQVFLPPQAPPEWQDREKLWNAVEAAEKAKDSRLARELVVALPIELNQEQQISLIEEFIQEQFVADGMCADAAIHDTDGHNPHAHILLTVRPLDEKGQWQYKTEKEYLCVRNGEERGFTTAEFLKAQKEGWEKQYPYKIGKRKSIWLRPQRRYGASPVQISTPKAAAMAVRIPLPCVGTARSSCFYGGKTGPPLQILPWSRRDVRNVSTTAVMPPVVWRKTQPSTRALPPVPWSARESPLTAAS